MTDMPLVPVSPSEMGITETLCIIKPSIFIYISPPSGKVDPILADFGLEAEYILGRSERQTQT